MKYQITYEERDHRMITELIVDASDLEQTKQDIKEEGWRITKIKTIQNS